MMKDIKNFILESTQDEDLQEEVGLALKKFGTVRNGFKAAKKQDIIDAMYKLGFDYDEENSTASKLVFSGEYIDDQYEVDLYIDKDSTEIVVTNPCKDGEFELSYTVRYSPSKKIDEGVLVKVEEMLHNDCTNREISEATKLSIPYINGVRKYVSPRYASLKFIVGGWPSVTELKKNKSEE